MKKWFALLSLAGCTSGTVNVNVTVYPDGTGEYTYYAFVPGDVRSGEKADPEGVLENIKELQSVDLTIRLVGGRFDALEKCRIGDVTFAWTVGGKSSTLRVTIPATADSRWYRALGLSREQLDKFKALEQLEATKKAAEQKGDEPPSVVFAVTMPGIVEKNTIVDPASPPAWRIGAEDRGGTTTDKEQKNTAHLTIPIEDILSGKVRQVVWEITCGPVLDKTRAAWEKFRRK